MEKFRSQIDEISILLEDVLLSNPPIYASFVCSSSVSQNPMWKPEKGVPLQHFIHYIKTPVFVVFESSNEPLD